MKMVIDFLREAKRCRNCISKYVNRIMFHLHGINYGCRMCVHGDVGLRISPKGQVTIGSDFYMSSGWHINPLSRNIEGNITVNDYAQLQIGNNVKISSATLRCHQSISIGNYVQIGGGTILMDSDAHSLDYMERRNLNIDKKKKHNAPIVIEDDVLIGAYCTVLKGVTIGARSVIGAGSVVVKSIPSDCIAAGNPCKVIKQISK